MATEPGSLTTSRISAIDTLRGFAVLGILLVNIQLFSMINAAHLNPSAYGDLTGWNYHVWFYTYSLAESKFIALFSMLFGSSMLLIHSRYQVYGLDYAITYQKRRFAVLMAIGLLHAYLLWPGDILVTYGLCGLLLLPVLHTTLTPRVLIISGILLLSIPSLNMLGSAVSPDLLSDDEIIQAIDQWLPSPASYQHELNAYRGNWLGQQQQRMNEAFHMHIQSMPLSFMWQCGGLMLIGMALFRLGILSASRSVQTYRYMMLTGFGLGLPILFYNSHHWAQTDWSLDYFETVGYQINYWAGPVLVVGYIGLIMTLCKSERLAWLTRPLAQTGRMALSNYLLQSLLCSLIFYGHGLGLFGKLERVEQFTVVLIIWSINILFSTIWLRHFQYGPIEFIWRRLSQRNLQQVQQSPA